MSKGHKEKICSCFICKVKRGATRGKKRPDQSKFMKENNPMKCPEVAVKTSKTRIKKGLSAGNNNPMKRPEVALKNSKAQSQLFVGGKIKVYNYYKDGYFYSQKSQKELYYRSSYELQAYKILEQLSKVIKYESEPFYIPYKFQERNHHYIPDILVTYNDSSQELIEVMREDLLDEKQRIAKINAAQDYANKNNMKFSIWTEKRLFKEN